MSCSRGIALNTLETAICMFIGKQDDRQRYGGFAGSGVRSPLPHLGFKDGTRGTFLGNRSEPLRQFCNFAISPKWDFEGREERPKSLNFKTP
ncbi:hypothetical protein J6590_024976 [Homalodisca vitripennis]|nr:hypothetical protein J6590_024976 [Homalodisca vitripennis]